MFLRFASIRLLIWKQSLDTANISSCRGKICGYPRSFTCSQTDFYLKTLTSDEQNIWKAFIGIKRQKIIASFLVRFCPFFCLSWQNRQCKVRLKPSHLNRLVRSFFGGGSPYLSKIRLRMQAYTWDACCYVNHVLREPFGGEEITVDRIFKALGQFGRDLISAYASTAVIWKAGMQSMEV